MKKIIIIIAIAILLGSCAKDELECTNCTQNQTVCLDEFGQQIECILINGVYYTPIGQVKKSGMVARSAPVSAGNNTWNLQVCQTFRQTYFGENGHHIDRLVNYQTSHVQIEDEGLVNHLQANSGSLFEVITDDNNIVISVSGFHGPQGTPCNNPEFWANQ